MKQKIPVIIAIILVLALAGCASGNLAGNHMASTPTENNTLRLLTKAEVEELVFTHANVPSADVVDLEIDLDEEDGTVYYDLEFDYGTNEYDYRVDALSGKILYNKSEPKETDVQTVASQPTETQPAETQPAETKTNTTTSTKKKIGVTKAKNAAFNHAGVKASDAWDVEVDLDTENGKLVYEVSFDAGGYEYDYDIDAYTGKVIRHEKERND